MTDLYPGPDVVIDGVHVDLDHPELPEEIEERAFASGGFPYDKKLKKDAYEAQLRLLQIELLKLQAWAKETGARIVVLFEGRDSAGKGGTIQRFTEHLNPRSARVVALAKPSDVERGQWYFQRYIAQLPAAGEIVLFDRSWYNRAVVEPVMGFATPAEADHFLETAPVFERMLVEDGIRLFKVWLTIGREMQLKRLFDRRHDPLKHWKLSPVDYEGLPKWDEYGAAGEQMLRRTHSKAAPWTVIRSNDKGRARLEAIRLVLKGIDYAGKDKNAIGKHDPQIVADAASFLTKGGQI
ncbi:polyphosphate kinase 2 [Terrihabitans sp. B22-R8]|uniref:polyphosphate kinase 2 n=1 Tax=Terrihabitans sp. B22-R8 TaxID=3425128 RepID=UPI00403D5397